MENINPIWVFISSFLVSSLSGLAALLRTTETFTAKKLLSSILNSGLLGLGISLIWYLHFKDNVYMLIGVCLMAGLGGMTVVDFILIMMKNGGFFLKNNNWENKNDNRTG